MKLRIIEAGWVNFTGNMGGVEFVDNVSVDEVSERDAFRIANVISVETLEGQNPSSSQLALDTLTVPMPVEGAQVPQQTPSAESQGGEKPPSVIYSRAQLEAVADMKGIEGMRAIAGPLGITSKSIVGLIDQIINQQGGEPAADTGEPVPQGLYGSSKQPSTFEVEGKTIQLGSVVRVAFEHFEKEGKTVQDWNDLPEEVREQLIAAQVAQLRV